MILNSNGAWARHTTITCDEQGGKFHGFYDSMIRVVTGNIFPATTRIVASSGYDPHGAAHGNVRNKRIDVKSVARISLARCFLPEIASSLLRSAAADSQ
jgi:hypothetical protein